MSDVEQSVTRVFEAYKAAVHARDVDAFMRIYDAKARIFDAWNEWEYNGAEQWRPPIDIWLNANHPGKTQVTFDDVHIAGSREFAGVSAIVTYAQISDQGEKLHAMQNRLTWILAARDDAFRVIHEHTSVPIDFEEMKPKFKRIKT